MAGSPSTLQLLTDLAQAAAIRAIDKSPIIRFRPGTLTGDTGYPVTEDVGTAEIPEGVIAALRLDGDSGLTYAQNISGEPYGAGTRVMCAYVPPHACYILGPIDHWPTERGLICEVDEEGGPNPFSTTSNSLVEASSLYRFSFVAPASGRVRVRITGGLIGTTGNDEAGMGIIDRDAIAIDALFAGADSTQRMSNWGEYNIVHYDRVASGLTPGQIYNWTPAIRRLASAATSTISWWSGSPGSTRIEVWAMPPLPSATVSLI